MDLLLWAAVATAFIVLVAAIARYRIIALAAAFLTGGAVLLDHSHYQRAPSTPEESGHQDINATETHDGPVAWSRLYIDSSSDSQSGKPANISALSIAGTNVSQDNLKLEEAYFVSGVNGSRLNIKIGRDRSRYKVQDLGPLPPGAFFFVESDPIDPTAAGLSPDEFLKTWATIYFVVKYDGKTQSIRFDREAVESALPKPTQP